MKNKLKIMNNRQEINDEELERFKDFDALLAKHQLTILDGSKNWLRWTVFGSTSVVGIIVAIFFFNKQEDVVVKNQTPQSIQKEIEPAREEVNSDLHQQESIKPEAAKSKTNVKHQEEKPADISLQKLTETKPVSPIYVQAEPIDGYSKLYDYFNRELTYPPAAVQDSIQGVLAVSFTVSRDGSVINIEFANTLGKLFEEEAIRLIKNMPTWKPATVNGTPVPSKMSLPLTFQIQDSAERKKD